MDADKYLQSIGCNWSASSILQGTFDQPDFDINEPRFSQPLCTILQIALVHLLREFGVLPATVVGHSSGEIAAAYAVGAISRESAWKLAHLRGLLCSQLADWSHQAKTPSGAMMAVGLSEESVRPYIDGAIADAGIDSVATVACINSPESVTVSGDRHVVHALQATLSEKGIFARVLKVPVAYHSPHMQVIASIYEQLIGKISPTEPSQHSTGIMVSSVTGTVVEHSELQKPEYWVRNMVSPVAFSTAINRLCHNSAQQTRKKLDLSYRNFVPIHISSKSGPTRRYKDPSVRP